MPQTVPILYEIEVNITRLLGASLTVLADTALFVRQPLPSISPEAFADSVRALEGRNRSLVLDGSLGEDVMLIMQRNATRILQLGVLVRVRQHLERSMELLPDEERVVIIRLLGPAADSIFLLGTRLLAALIEPPISDPIRLDVFTWETLMVDGTFQIAREELTRNRSLGREGRRAARATLWALQVARDAFLVIGSR